MIIDKIKNINLYTNIPKKVREFIENLTPDIEEGKIFLDNEVYVNVEKYTPKLVENAKFESHKKYIDIQIVLNSCETIYVENFKKLTPSVDYDEKKDIIFYKNTVEQSLKCDLDGTNFILLYPHEAHAPQVCLNNCQTVKKVVVKIPV